MAGRLAPELRRGRIALALIFFSLGLLAASWAARIPAVKASLHLSAGALGVALLGPAVGLVASTVPTGALLARFRTRPVIAAGTVLFAVSMPLVPEAPSEASLFAVLLVWGLGFGMIDVAMNTEAAALQTRAARPIMSGLHASYSVGGLVGAGTGALAAAAGVSPGWHLLVASGACGVMGLGAVARLPDGEAPSPGVAHRSGRVRSLPELSWGLVALALVAFGCFLAEGAANDWSAVYLHSSLGASVGFAALGYTVFAVAMATGRLAGDRLGSAFGPVRMVRVSTGLAAIGFSTALAVGSPAVGLVGFAVLGLGLSVVVPQVFSAASTLGSGSGPSLALVTGCGYVGLMAGPPLIGGLADAVGLPTALLVIVAVAVTAALLARSLAPATAASAGPAAVAVAAATGAGAGADADASAREPSR